MATERAMSGRPGRGLLIAKRIGSYALLVAVAFVVLFPIYITVVNSLLPTREILARPPTFFPTSPRFSAYTEAFGAGHLGRYLVNSFIVTSLITAGQVGTAILAAYAFAFLDFPLKRTIFFAFLATLMVPFEVTIVSNYDTIVNKLGWGDSYQALVLPFLATGFAAFLLRQTFLGVPRDLRDAAALDGYGHLRFLGRVVVPLARPTIAALSVFSFLLAWNQYLWPLIVTNDEKYRTVQIGLKALRGESLDKLDVVFAGTIIAAIPIFVLLIVFNKQLVRGLTQGAVKG
ncbi:MAG TPA: carbohydrate ABC transporter permease [Acidimicrobiia bacterium]|nr:carbohydrate ABC transporter permease [Acidimicrobiia bacterium]